MADAGDAFGLPEGMLSAGDPVEGNPFPETTRQHQVWSDATRRAEEERCRLNSRLLGERPAPEAENYADWMIALIVGKFDIWARRGVHVVWSDTEVLAFDQWLFNYAQAWLESARTAPILGHAESALNELRLKLMERIEFWKAEGRRYVTNQKAFQRAKMEAVDAGWLRIQSMRLGGAKLSDCLKEAYDHHAGLFAKAGEPFKRNGSQPNNSRSGVQRSDSSQMDSLSIDPTRWRESCGQLPGRRARASPFRLRVGA